MKKAILVLFLLLGYHTLHSQPRMISDSLSESPADTSAIPADILIDAVQKYSDRDISGAKALLDSAISMDPSLDAAYYYRGICSYMEGNLAGAEKDFEEAVRLDTLNCYYRESLASVYGASGKAGKVGEIYTWLIRRYPSRYTNSYTLCLLAEDSEGQGDKDKALEYYEQALVCEPGYVPALLGKADLLRMKGDLRSFFDIMREFSGDPGIDEDAKGKILSSMMIRLGDEFLREHSEDIVSLVNAFVQGSPSSMKAHQLNRNVLSYYGRFGDVLSDLDECIKSAGSDTLTVLDCMREKADFLSALGLNRNAIRVYKDILKINPSDVIVLNNYAYLLATLGRGYRKALSMSRTVIDSEPDNPTYLDTYGWILYLMGKADEAKPVFKHAMIYGGTDSEVILEHYAAVLEALGEKEQAARYRDMAGKLKKQ